MREVDRLAPRERHDSEFLRRFSLRIRLGSRERPLRMRDMGAGGHRRDRVPESPHAVLRHRHDVRGVFRLREHGACARRNRPAGRRGVRSDGDRGTQRPQHIRAVRRREAGGRVRRRLRDVSERVRPRRALFQPRPEGDRRLGNDHSESEAPRRDHPRRRAPARIPRRRGGQGGSRRGREARLRDVAGGRRAHEPRGPGEDRPAPPALRAFPRLRRPTGAPEEKRWANNLCRRGLLLSGRLRPRPRHRLHGCEDGKCDGRPGKERCGKIDVLALPRRARQTEYGEVSQGGPPTL